VDESSVYVYIVSSMSKYVYVRKGSACY
jgi:hypothetical protein